MLVWVMVFLMGGRSQGADARLGTRLVSFSPSEVVLLAVSNGDAWAQAELHGSGLWLINGVGEGDRPEAHGTWFAEPTRVRSAVRLLSDLVIRGRASGGGALRGRRVEVELRSGERFDLAFEATGVAGFDRVSLGGERWLVDAGLADALTPAGVRAWVSREPFPGMDVSARAIAFGDVGQEGAFEIRRTGERWGVVSPVTVAADAGLVRGWLSSGGASDGAACRRVRVDAAAGSAVRSWQADATEARAWLVESEGNERELGGRLAGSDCPRGLVLEEVISRRASDVLPSQVVSVAVGEALARRVGDGWDGSSGGAWGEDVVGLLLSTPADRVTLGGVSGVDLVLRGRSGRELETFSVATENGELLVSSEGVVWRYSEEVAPSVTRAEVARVLELLDR